MDSVMIQDFLSATIRIAMPLLIAAVGGGQAPVLRVPLLQPWPVPFLSDIPFVGPLLFEQPPLTYLALFLLVFVQLYLFKTRSGLTLRAVGENPLAAYAAGAQPAQV